MGIITVARPKWTRRAEYVYIRPYRGNEPGDPFDMNNIRRLKSLFRKKKVGPKGHPWTKACIDQYNKTGLLKAYRFVQVDQDEVPSGDVVQDLSESSEPEKEVLVAQEPVKLGSRWKFPEIEGAPSFTSKTKALAWLEKEQINA